MLVAVGQSQEDLCWLCSATTGLVPRCSTHHLGARPRPACPAGARVWGLNDGSEPCLLLGPLFLCRAAAGGTAEEQGTAQSGPPLAAGRLAQRQRAGELAIGERPLMDRRRQRVGLAVFRCAIP